MIRSSLAPERSECLRASIDSRSSYWISRARNALGKPLRTRRFGIYSNAPRDRDRSNQHGYGCRPMIERARLGARADSPKS
jgi:hypothetical protein